MPILNVDQSQAIVVLKRSMNPGFAGIDNPLFVEPEDRDAVRRRQGIRREARRRRQGSLNRPGSKSVELRRALAEDRARDELAAREPEHVAVARVAAGDPDVVAAGHAARRAATGRASCPRSRPSGA